MNKWFSSFMKGELKKSKILKNAYEYFCNGVLCTIELRPSTFLTGDEQNIVVISAYVLEKGTGKNGNIYLIFESMIVDGRPGWREQWSGLDHWDDTKEDQEKLSEVLSKVVIPWIKEVLTPELMIDFMISMHDENEILDTVVDECYLMEILRGMKSSFPSRMWTLNYLAVSYLFECLGNYRAAVEYINLHKLKVEKLFSKDKKMLANKLKKINDILMRIEKANAIK